jgi:hypothetical protein
MVVAQFQAQRLDLGILEESSCVDSIAPLSNLTAISCSERLGAAAAAS